MFGTAFGEMPVMSPAPASSAEFRLGVAADGCVSVVVSLTSDSYPLFSYEAYGGTGDWPFVLFVAVVDGFGVFGAAVLFESFAFSALLGVRRAFRFFSGCFFNLKQGNFFCDLFFFKPFVILKVSSALYK